MHDTTPPPRRARGPLADCRVLELGSTIAGPFCGRLLADFGADVVKVETPEGDALRSMGKRVDGHSMYAATLLRNKRIAAIDLRTAEGQDIVRRMAQRCDVLIENFRPGAMEQWGLGYEALSATNPGLAMVRISGFGQAGPYSQRAGYGIVAEAVSGLRTLIGDPDRPPARVAVALTDCVTAIYAAFGALMAIHARRTSGRGQVVDAALYEGAFSLLDQIVPAYDKLGFIAQRAGSRLDNSAPNNLYPAADGQHVHITAIADAVFRRLAQTMDQPGLADDPRFATTLARAQHMDELDGVLAAWTRTVPAAELEHRLNAAGVPAARVYTIADIFADPHYRAREMLASVPHDALGELTMAAPVPRLSATPGALHHAGRGIGHDTAEVLRQWAGLDDAGIAALEARGVVRLRSTGRP